MSYANSLARIEAALELIEKKAPPGSKFDAAKHPRKKDGEFAPKGQGGTGLSKATVNLIGAAKAKSILAAKTGLPAKMHAGLLRTKAANAADPEAHHNAAAELHAYGQAKHKAYLADKAKAKTTAAAAKPKTAKPAPGEHKSAKTGSNLLQGPEHEITKDEAFSVRKYQNGAYSTINGVLFGKYKEELAPEHKAIVGHLDTAISKSIIKEDQPTFRGIADVKRYTSMKGFSVGAEISLGGGFLSTSKDYGQAEEFAHKHQASKSAVLIIKNKKGQTGLDVNQRLKSQSLYEGEKELILPRDTRVRVVAIRLKPDAKDKYKFPHIILERIGG